MDLSIRMRIIFDVKHLHLVRLKVGDILNFSNQVSGPSESQYLL